MNTQSESKLSKIQKLFSVLPPVLLIVLNIFLFGPFTIYQGNLNEFAISFISIISGFILPSLILFFTFVGIGILLPVRLHRLYVSILFILGLLTWIQGNILVWKYGLFDGQGIDWNLAQWRGWVDGGIWIALLTLSFIFYKNVYKIVVTGSLVLICLQFVLAGYVSITKPEIWKNNFPELNLAPKWASEFSSNKNVIHFILDGFQSDIFKEIIEHDHDYYSKVFEGFTFFKEATGSFPTTYLSVPAILSGKVYQNDIPIPDFIKKTLTGKTIPNVLYDNGYEVDLIPTVDTYSQGKFTHSYIIPDPYVGTIEDFEKAKSALMIDLVLFRQMPHYLKQSIYKNQQWFIQKLAVQQECMQFKRFGHEDFLSDIIKAMSQKRDKPVYKFYHFMTTHVPFVVNKDCKCAGTVLPSNRENALIQSNCSLDHFIEFLNRLKSLGIYDKSLIILQGDHGSVVPVEFTGQDNQWAGNPMLPIAAASATPLMLIKQPNSIGPLRISDAQVMITDVPATIKSELNINDTLPGQSVFEIQPTKTRERKFYDYRWRDSNWLAEFLPPLTEYIITGNVHNQGSWHLGKQNSYAGDILLKTKKIDFGSDSSAYFLRHGWSSYEADHDEKGITFTWAIGKTASIFLTLPKTRVRMTANVKSPFYNEQQLVTVKVDGKEVGKWRNSKTWEWERHSVIIKSDDNRPSVSTIDFIFSQYLEPNKNDNRQLALVFESIILEDN